MLYKSTQWIGANLRHCTLSTEASQATDDVTAHSVHCSVTCGTERMLFR